jgi:hypothetical protein
VADEKLRQLGDDHCHAAKRDGVKASSVPATKAPRILPEVLQLPSLSSGRGLAGRGATCVVVVARSAEVAAGGAGHRMWWEARVMPSFFIRLRRVLGEGQGVLPHRWGR